MQIQQLRHLLATTEHRSLVRAAQALGISQPALSKSLRRLEDYLRVKLFERTPRGLMLTEYGRELAERVRPIAVDLKEAERAIAAIRDGVQGQVTVGCSPSPMSRVLPQAVARLIERHDALRITVIGGLNDRLIEQLQAGEIDLVLSNLVDDRAVPDLRQETLYTDRVVVAARADHPLARRRSLKPDAIRPYRWALPGANVVTRRHLETTLVRLGLGPPALALESDSVPFMSAILRETDCLGYLPEVTLQAGREGAGLAELDLPALAWLRPMGVTVRRQGVVSPASENLLSMLRQVSRSLAGRPRARAANARAGA
jgi:DNA-binding transcriptional LysR family regulator